MAITPQIESAIEQMGHFGGEEKDFEAYMTIVCPLVGLYADQGKFRQMARPLWLMGNKDRLKKVIANITSGPTLVEQEAEVQGELQKAGKALEHFVSVFIGTTFASMGFRKGDILTVQGSDGKQRNIVFDGNLPALGEDYREWIDRNAPEEVRAQIEKMFPST